MLRNRFKLIRLALCAITIGVVSSPVVAEPGVDGWEPMANRIWECRVPSAANYLGSILLEAPRWLYTNDPLRDGTEAVAVGRAIIPLVGSTLPHMLDCIFHMTPTDSVAEPVLYRYAPGDFRSLQVGAELPDGMPTPSVDDVFVFAGSINNYIENVPSNYSDAPVFRGLVANGKWVVFYAGLTSKYEWDISPRTHWPCDTIGLFRLNVETGELLLLALDEGDFNDYIVSDQVRDPPSVGGEIIIPRVDELLGNPDDSYRSYFVTPSAPGSNVGRVDGATLNKHGVVAFKLLAKTRYDGNPFVGVMCVFDTTENKFRVIAYEDDVVSAGNFDTGLEWNGDQPLKVSFALLGHPVINSDGLVSFYSQTHILGYDGVGFDPGIGVVQGPTGVFQWDPNTQLITTVIHSEQSNAPGLFKVDAAPANHGSIPQTHGQREGVYTVRPFLDKLSMNSCGDLAFRASIIVEEFGEPLEAVYKWTRSTNTLSRLFTSRDPTPPNQSETFKRGEKGVFGTPMINAAGEVATYARTGSNNDMFAMHKRDGSSVTMALVSDSVATQHAYEDDIPPPYGPNGRKTTGLRAFLQYSGYQQSAYRVGGISLNDRGHTLFYGKYQFGHNASQIALLSTTRDRLSSTIDTFPQYNYPTLFPIAHTGGMDAIDFGDYAIVRNIMVGVGSIEAGNAVISSSGVVIFADNLPASDGIPANFKSYIYAVPMREPVVCQTDLNNDNVIDTADLGVFFGSFGACSGDCPADFNGDGVVDTADMGILLGQFGKKCDIEPCSEN